MTILFFARDPGPANQIVAAYELLAAKTGKAISEGARNFVAECGPHLPAEIYAFGAAVDVWRRAGIEPRPFSENDVRKSFENGIAHVITGTSDIDDESDRKLWLLAREQGAVSHAFIDHPANLETRFRLRDGTPAFPDKIHVPDEGYIPLLVSAGVPRSLIDVTGPIHAERLRTLLPDEKSKQELRKKWQANERNFVILFASECAAEMAKAGRPSPYDEFAVLEDLTRTIAASGTLAGRKLEAGQTLLIVRPHPRDSTGKYDEWQSRSDNRPVRLISCEGTPEQAIIAADLVVGMDSSLLREALALDQLAISLTGANLSL